MRAVSDGSRTRVTGPAAALKELPWDEARWEQAGAEVVGRAISVGSWAGHSATLRRIFKEPEWVTSEKEVAPT